MIDRAKSTRPGRNDPCWCGSGKKYKHCHLRLEQSVQSGQLALERAKTSLYKRLADFGRQFENEIEFPAAFNLFWNGLYPLDTIGQMRRDQLMRFLDWFLFDYELSEARRPVIEVFAEHQGESLPPPEREWVARPATPAEDDVIAQIARQMEAQVIVGPLDQHYARWLDRPIAAWSNRTPRQVAKTEKGREQLHLLFDLLEQAERRRAAAGQPTDNFDRLRVELNLWDEAPAAPPSIYRV